MNSYPQKTRVIPYQQRIYLDHIIAALIPIIASTPSQNLDPIVIKKKLSVTLFLHKYSKCGFDGVEFQCNGLL